MADQGPAGGPQYPGAPGSAGPGWYYPPPQPQTEGMAIAALVLAIASFVVFPVVLAVVALILAPNSRRKIAASGGRLTGEPLLKAAVILSWVNIAIGIAVFLLVIVLVLIALLATSTSGLAGVA